MRIGIDIKAFKNGTTGIARYLRSIMDRLQSIDHDNHYFLFSCAQSDYHITNPKWKKLFIPWKLPGILWQQFVLPGHLRRHNIDVLWAPEQVCPVYCDRRIKIVSTAYDLTFLRFPETCQPSNRWIQTVLFPQTIRRSFAITPISDYVKHEIERTYPAEVRNTLVEPVYCGGPEWSIPSDYAAGNRQNFLFFPGNREPRKNLHRLIGALELLHEKHGLSVPLHLAGPSGWKNSTLLSLLENSPVKNLVTHLGYLSETALQKEYLTCRALVYPSLYEGFGLPVLEALALDCPVMTSRGTVMEEIAGDAAMYFDPDDTASIARTIGQIFEERFDREICLNRKSAALDKFSWDRSAKKLLSLFNQTQ